MAVVSMENAVRDYEVLRVELRSLRWRSIVILLGSTFLVLFWFLQFGDMLIKLGFMGRLPLRAIMTFPISTTAYAWLVWVTSLVFRQGASFERDQYASDDELDILYRIEFLRRRLTRENRYNNFINVLIGLGFVGIAGITGIVFIGIR